MNAKENEWTVTAGEINAYCEAAGLKKGPLNALPTGNGVKPDVEAVLAERSSLSEEQLSLLDTVVAVLGAPDKVIRLHYSIEDSIVSRSILATSHQLPGFWSVLGGSNDPLSLSTRSETEIRFLVADVLGALAGEIPMTIIGCDFSTDAAIAFLSALDQDRRSWLISIIRHLQPVEIFTLEDIRNRLADSSVEDFRWALPFVDKLLPFPVSEMAVADEPRPALVELLEAGIIEPVEEMDSGFNFTEAGRALAEMNRQAVSRVAISVTEMLGEEETAHDIYYFVRSKNGLFMVLMSGAEASLATILPADLEKLLRYIFGYRTRDVDSAHRTRFCRHCGQQLSPAATFCGQCGEKI